LDMLKSYAHVFCKIGKLLAELSSSPASAPAAMIDGELKETYVWLLQSLIPDVKEVKLGAVGRRIRRMLDDLERGITTGEAQVLVRTLNETIEDELKRRMFLRIPQTKAKYYDQEHLFGEEVSLAFPSGKEDLRAAGTAYSCGCNTACVFHLMRAVEHAVLALARDRRVHKLDTRSGGSQFPIQMGTWEDILRALTPEVNKVAGWERAKGEIRNQAVEFYNSAIEEIRAIKDGWRNPTMHARGQYMEEDANQVMAHVRRLMVTLSSRISETKRTPVVWTRAQLR
jgi:hypothetical protein